MPGKRIKELRIENGYTLKQLGEMLNLGESTMSMYESGKRKPDYDTLIRLSQIFGVTTDYLLGVSDIRDPNIAQPIAENTISYEVDDLSEESKKELENYIRLLKIRDQVDKGKEEQSSALEKKA